MKRVQVVNKIEFIINYAGGKNVLHLGCIDHDLFEAKQKRNVWLHEKLAEVAEGIVGLDILSEHIPLLRKKGHDIRWGDVEHFEDIDINMHFDLIVAGEIIEHLLNPGLFLSGVKKYFSENTEMIVTTPNCFALRRIPATLKNRELTREDHTCWYSHNTLKQLLEINGYKIGQVLFYAYMKQDSVGSKIQRRFYRIFPRLADGLVFVVQPIR